MGWWNRLHDLFIEFFFGPETECDKQGHDWIVCIAIPGYACPTRETHIRTCPYCGLEQRSYDNCATWWR